MSNNLNGNKVYNLDAILESLTYLGYENVHESTLFFIFGKLTKVLETKYGFTYKQFGAFDKFVEDNYIYENGEYTLIKNLNDIVEYYKPGCTLKEIIYIRQYNLIEVLKFHEQELIEAVENAREAMISLHAVK